jgi:outer membrane protein assembly factor BamA
MLILACVVLSVSPLAAQSDTADMQPEATPGDPERRLRLSQLEALRIDGCVESTPEQILGVMDSRESEKSVTRSIGDFYYENLRRNTATPPPIMRYFDDLHKQTLNELRYYDPRTAEADSLAIYTWLYQNGFHRGAVRYEYLPRPIAARNTLVFTITEGPRAVLDTIIAVGLDSLDPGVHANVMADLRIPRGTPYSEAEVELHLNKALTTMRNTGYYLSRYERPLIMSDDSLLHDTIAVKFITGNRYRITDIVFQENANNQPSVYESTRRAQLEFEIGEWFDESKVQKSRQNLIRLGAFETVVIDTIGRDDGSVVMVTPQTDSSLNLRVFTKNNKVYDAGVNLLLYQTMIDSYLNFGIGTNALYRNTFGGAQTSQLDLQYVLQDISSLLQGQPIQTEALAQFSLTWPFVFKFAGSRAGVTSRVMYSIRELISDFRLESFGVGGSMPIQLPRFTMFTNADITTTIERQLPLNYDAALQEALDEANTPEDTANVYATYNQFVVLDEYLTTTGNFFTGIFIGGSLRGEHRNNIINPTSGTFTNIALEVGLGAGNFYRAQLFNTIYTQIARRAVLATKVKLGHIFLFDPDSNTYVPLERQFFAGGASSIRSFASRLLHDPGPSGQTGDTVTSNTVQSNIVGSGTIIEFGLEYRYSFPRPRGLDDLWASIIERSGVTAFMDVGNAFNRLVLGAYGKATLNDFITGSVIAGGVGYRFDTPVGPFRIDYATSIYDPTRTSGQWIFNKRSNLMGLGNWQLSIALGFAF